MLQFKTRNQSINEIYKNVGVRQVMPVTAGYSLIMQERENDQDFPQCDPFVNF